MRICILFFLLAIISFGWLQVPASAQVQQITQTFDELPFQPIDELAFKRVVFDFKVGGIDSLEADYGSFGPGILTFVSDPSLVGNSTGILTIDFDVPTTVVELAVALSTGSSLIPGYTVELFDGSMQSLGIMPVDTVSVSGSLGFSEGMFTYTGAPVIRAVVDFEDSPGSFALDNLTYQVPEPSSLMILVFGVALTIPVFECRLVSSLGQRKATTVRSVWSIDGPAMFTLISALWVKQLCRTLTACDHATNDFVR